MPGEYVALQQPADEPRVIAEKGWHLVRAAWEGCHSDGISRWHVVQSVRGPGVDGLMGSLEPGQEAPVIKQCRLLTEPLAVDPGGSAPVDGY